MQYGDHTIRCRLWAAALAVASVAIAAPAFADDHANQVSASLSAREDRFGGNLSFMHAFSGDLSDASLLFRFDAGAGAMDDGEDSRSADLLLGYQFVEGSWKVRTLGGIVVIDRDDGSDLGFKLQAQVQNKKTDKIYVNATAGYNSANERSNAGLQVGTQLGTVVVGPDFSLVVTDDYTRTGFGAFLTGVKLGDVGLTFRGGYSLYDGDGDTGDSAFLTIGATLQY